MTALVKPLPKLKKKQLTSQQKKLPNFQLGEQGESQAADYLITHGFTILDVNVRFGNLEVDIIAIDQVVNELVFVEVKTRSSDFFGHPSVSVNYRKLLSLQKVATQYRKEHQLWLDFRFDLIAILPNSIEHYPNISWKMVK